MLRAPLLAAAVLLAACVPSQQPVASAADEVDAYCYSLYEDPPLDPVRGRMAFHVEQVTAAQLADATFPTEPERAAIRAYADIKRQCHDRIVQAQQVEAPATVPAVLDGASRTDQLIAALQDRRITYAEFAALLQQSHQMIRQDLAAIRQPGSGSPLPAIPAASAAPGRCRWVGSSLSCAPA